MSRNAYEVKLFIAVYAETPEDAQHVVGKVLDTITEDDDVISWDLEDGPAVDITDELRPE